MDFCILILLSLLTLQLLIFILLSTKQNEKILFYIFTLINVFFNVYISICYIKKITISPFLMFSIYSITIYMYIHLYILIIFKILKIKN